MKKGFRIEMLRRLILGRVARNVWFWGFLMYIAHGYNMGNEAAFGYRLISSDVYIPVMVAMLLIQGGLMYVNNLLLVPRLLARKRYAFYILSAIGLCILTGLATTVTMKLGVHRLDVQHLHHAAFTTTSITKSWTWSEMFHGTNAFATSDMIWLAAFTLAWYANDYTRQQRALKESEAQRLKTELAFLRNQLNPHFLFNTLNNIYGLVYLKSDAAPELILKLSSLLRYLLYETNVETIAWSRERSAIEAYAEIESLRLPDSAQLRIDLQTDGDYMLPPLLWLPVLENSFKHGSRLIQETVFLDFSVRILAGHLSIRASNRFEPSLKSDSGTGGLGLQNLRKRLEILYSGKHEIRETVSGNEYCILIDITLTD